MSRYYQRPENALKRATEFIEVGKPARALDTLYEVIRSRKRAHNCSEKILEPIMFKYLDLCVELKKSHFAKEGLFQYRNLCQMVNVASLENVVRGYLQMAEDRTDQAREQSQQAVVDIDDLDNVATPESILLSAVSGEDAQDRTDRAILTPWVKFLWESYCQCLELLRTNARVERLYHYIAQMTFRFCLKYTRKTEFRKLCDKLRKHLDDILKLPPGPMNINLNNADTQQLNLETRLIQLDSAIQMELWQEAYKAIEDIHGLMALSKKLPQPKMMANYYQKLALVFWKANNFLFHAAALFKLFQLSKEMKKNITSEELQKMASRVLVATLSVPLPTAHPEFDRFIETDKTPAEKAQRLAVLLGLPQPPTRQSLVRDLTRSNVVGAATPELQELYSWLEEKFQPLQLCRLVAGVVEKIETQEELTHLEQYVPALKDITLVRLVKQVAQVYQTIEFEHIIKLAHFTTVFHLERILVDAVRHNDMQIRIDHAKRCIHFGMDLSEAQREDLPEGPTMQSMPSEQIRNQLINMNGVLHRAINTINPQKKKVEREELRSQIVAGYHQTKGREHQRILARHKIIEDRKETLERQNTVREEEEARRQEELLRQQMLAEQKRLEQEREEREKRRQEDEIRQIQARHIKEKVLQISQTSVGQRVIKNMDEEDLMKMDPEQIMARQVEELEKERRELQNKLKAQEKKVDYFERAKRIEEIPQLQKHIADKQAKDRELWEQYEQERISQLIEERKLAVQHRDCLVRMKPDKEKFLESLKKGRRSVYQEKLAEFQKLLEETRKKRMLERKQKRKAERKARWLRQKEEEEQLKRDEELKRKREEEEQADRQRKEEEEERHNKRMKELEMSAELQRQKQQEIEDRLAKEETQLKQSRGIGGVITGENDWRRKDDAGPPKELARPSNKWQAVDAAGVDRYAPRRGDWESRSRPERDGDEDREADREKDRERGPAFPPSRDRETDRDLDIRRGGDRDRDFLSRDRDKERDLPPRERDLPPKERDLPPRERDLPPRERDLPPRERDFPPRERDFPPRERDFPPRERDFPPRERDFPPRERDFPPRERDFPSRDRDRDFPSRDRDRDFPSRDRDDRTMRRGFDDPRSWREQREREPLPRDRDRDFRDGGRDRDREFDRSDMRGGPRGGGMSRDSRDFRGGPPEREHNWESLRSRDRDGDRDRDDRDFGNLRRDRRGPPPPSSWARDGERDRGVERERSDRDEPRAAPSAPEPMNWRSGVMRERRPVEDERRDGEPGGMSGGGGRGGSTWREERAKRPEERREPVEDKRDERKERLERPLRQEKSEKAEVPQRMERLERAPRPERSDGPDRPEAPDKPERTERPLRAEERKKPPVANAVKEDGQEPVAAGAEDGVSDGWTKVAKR